MKLNLNKPYATVHGHDSACYQQDGLLFGALLELLPGQIASKEKVEDENLVTDGVASAMAFLKQVLSDRPVEHAQLFEVAGRNNQNWEDVKKALKELKVIKIKQGGKDAYKLPEA